MFEVSSPPGQTAKQGILSAAGLDFPADIGGKNQGDDLVRARSWRLPPEGEGKE